MTKDKVQSPPAIGERGSRRFSGSASDEFSRAESVAAAIRRAFPLPESGAFVDLLAALEDQPEA